MSDEMRIVKVLRKKVGEQEWGKEVWDRVMEVDVRYRKGRGYTLEVHTFLEKENQSSDGYKWRSMLIGTGSKGARYALLAAPRFNRKVMDQFAAQALQHPALEGLIQQVQGTEAVA